MAENKTHYAKGTYKCKLSGEYGFGQTTSEKKTPFFEAAFTVMASVDPINKEEKACEQQLNRKVTVYLTTKTQEYAVDQLKALGWDGTSLTRLDRTKPGYQDLEGTEFLAYVKHEAGSDGNTYERWNISTGEPKGKMKVASEEGVSQDLDDLFGLSPRAATIPVTAADTSDGSEFLF